MKSYSPRNWYALAKDLYGLIAADISSVSSDTLPEIYPKLVENLVDPPKKSAVMKLSI